MASFDENGKYIKTNWKAGDKITATKLNKIEESIEAVNDNDISRHVEADARLDALEAKDVAHDKELTKIKNTIADNKAAAELGDYDINSRMTFLENELNEGIEEVHNVAETVDGKIAQGKADMEAMVAEVAEVEEELSEQLAHNVRYIKLSILGLGTDSFENLNIILSKLTSNNIIFVVDGDYKIATKEIKDLNYDFNLISFNNGSLTFDSTSNETFFNIKSSVNIENVNFINNTDNSKNIFTTLDSNNSTIEKFKVVNCKFNGTFRLAQLTTCIEVKTIELINNDVRNTTTSFFQTSDFKINSVIIKGNYVQNWLYRFISMTNFENIENMVISDNTATNTDDWMLSEQVDPSTYYVFALVKAKKIHYFNNHVENIKSKYDVALYDCYAYTDYYIYENNIFKNNVCFDTSANNVLMKCKNEGSNKTFKNNLFIIEDEFLNKFNVDKNTFKVKLYDMWGGFEDEVHTKPVDYYIEGNKIIVPNLQLEESYRFINSFIFTNNHIKCSNIYNNLINSKSEGAFIKITNNTFENEKGDTFHLIDGKSNIKYSNVEIIGNNINSLKYGIASALVNNCIINNNVINFNCDGAARLTTYLTTDYMVCKGNVLYGATQPTEYDYLGVTNNLLSNNLGSLKNSSIYLHKLDITNTKTIKVKVIDVNVDSIFTVKVKSDGATFIDSNGNERTFALLSTTGNGTMIKNNGQGSATLTFNNTETYSRLSLTTNTTEYIEVKIFIN